MMFDEKNKPTEQVSFMAQIWNKIWKGKET